MSWQEIHHIDQLLTLEINSWHSFITDPIWAFFSDKFVWAPMYAAIIALLIWKLGWKRGLIVLAGALLTFGFCDQFSNLIKELVARVRPLNDEFMITNGLNVLEKGSRSFSFFFIYTSCKNHIFTALLNFVIFIHLTRILFTDKHSRTVSHLPYFGVAPNPHLFTSLGDGERVISYFVVLWA